SCPRTTGANNRSNPSFQIFFRGDPRVGLRRPFRVPPGVEHPLHPRLRRLPVGREEADPVGEGGGGEEEEGK
ncbi:MAG TPA: hypothetical protein VIJ02_01555, partial [Thermoanaerobaculia bacterium]